MKTKTEMMEHEPVRWTTKPHTPLGSRPNGFSNPWASPHAGMNPFERIKLAVEEKIGYCLAVTIVAFVGAVVLAACALLWPVRIMIDWEVQRDA
jgi:hypothetical protein